MIPHSTKKVVHKKIYTSRMTKKAPQMMKKGPLIINPFTPKSDLIDFILSNARRFYSSKGHPLGVKGLRYQCTPKLTILPNFSY